MSCQLKFENINFTVVKSGKKCCKPGEDKVKKILQNVNGVVEPGEILAIIGSSGSGKTSLLNILAGRTPHRKWTGEVVINDRIADRRIMKTFCGYVPQEDVLLGSQTVYEALMFYANLGLPSKTKHQEKVTIVENIMEELGLTRVRDNMIGYSGEDASTSAIKRGISGGERKRLGIGLQLVSDPSVIFLDEPTTGLDSYISENLIETLSSLAAKGKTIILTVHQPSTELLTHFDKLMILAHGQTVYFGPYGQAIDYFAEIGYECPIDENPADYFIKILHLNDKGKLQGYGNTEKKAKELAKVFKRSEYHELTKQSKVAPVTEILSKDEELPNFGTQFRHLANRELQILTRDPSAFFISVLTNLLIGFVIGLIYWDLGNDQTSIQDRTGVLFFMVINSFFAGLLGPFRNVIVESRVFYFQVQEGLHSIGPYYFSRVMWQIPQILISNLLVTSVTYFMVGFQLDFLKFVVFYLGVCCLTWSSLGLGFFLLYSLEPTVAQTLYPVIFVPMMIFSGFYSNSARTPIYLQWIEFVSFIKYGYRLVAQSEFTGLVLECREDELVSGVCPYTSGEEYLTYRDLNVAPITNDFITLLGLGLGFLILAYIIVTAKVSKTKND
eukprot:TRINITY_DN390_c0_g1_i1.p1 TRINITY_DN390_c0_g1~~TRINITY_DN390_c0_g1_i1.p1  ORF type:complete len:613 (-),score=120.87 TRINITY_DN390_c0_g1_i1:68-1906(-)